MENNNPNQQGLKPKKGKTKVVGVRFKNSSKVYYFAPRDIQFVAGDGVIVETIRGAEYAWIATPNSEVDNLKITQPLKNVIRKATERDAESMQTNTARVEACVKMCEGRIAAHKLDMTIIDCDVAFDGSHITFYFTTSDDNKVDFRELLRDIVPMFRTRIELRQVKRRSKAKTVGGMGVCGRAVCCSLFLPKWEHVTIKMAKDQNIALSPAKISGVCGKLMCCLRYEHDSYERMRKCMPKVGDKINTPDGLGTVIDNNVLTERTKLKVQLPDGTIDLREYPLSELDFVQPKCECCTDIQDAIGENLDDNFDDFDIDDDADE